jgi:hypothetical protein
MLLPLLVDFYSLCLPKQQVCYFHRNIEVINNEP